MRSIEQTDWFENFVRRLVSLVIATAFPGESGPVPPTISELDVRAEEEVISKFQAVVVHDRV